MNALKHGLLSSRLLLPDEDSEAFALFSESLRATIQPANELEGILFERILSASWRLKRLDKVEVGIFEVGRTPGRAGESVSIGLAFIRDGNTSDGLGKLARYESSTENRLYRAMSELVKLRSETEKN